MLGKKEHFSKWLTKPSNLFESVLLKHLYDFKETAEDLLVLRNFVSFLES